MTSFEIGPKRDPVRIYPTTGEADNPLAFRFNPPDSEGWQHLIFQLNYVDRDQDLTVEQGYYFRVHGGWRLPENADDICGLFASVMWQTVQDVEPIMKQRGVQSTHKYEWLLERVQLGLKEMNWP